MDKIEKLENRIEELEKKLERKQNKPPAWKRLTRAVFVEWDDNYKYNFVKNCSFPEDHKLSAFDLNKLLKAAPNDKAKTPKKLEYWEAVYTDLKQVLGEHYGKRWWDLCYFVEMSVKYYESRIMEYILENGKYVDFGGPRERKDVKRKAYQIFNELDRDNSDYFHQDKKWKGHPKWDEVEPILRERLIDEFPDKVKQFGSLRSIKDYIREQEK